MGNNAGRPRISSIDDTKNFKYFNIFNYIRKYYPNAKLSINVLNLHSEFFNEYEFNNNKYIILTIEINKNSYSTSLWIFKPDDKSYNIYDIEYHDKYKTDSFITKFIDIAKNLN